MFTRTESALFCTLSLHDTGNPKLLGDLGKITRLTLILLRRTARDHLENGDPGKPSQNLLLDAVGKVGVIWIAAQVFKRKHRDAFFHGSSERTNRSFAQKRENRSG